MGKWLNFTFALTGRVYVLIPRALPWAVDWLPFQGAPFRALFVYHVRMLCRHAICSQNRAEIFLDFAPQPFNTLLISVACSNSYSATH